MGLVTNEVSSLRLVGEMASGLEPELQQMLRLWTYNTNRL